MVDVPSFHVSEDGTVWVDPELIQQMEQDGLNVRETLTGLLTTNVLEEGPINDEYCWMHQPGGWTCSVCRQS